jgi:hypothetical protein
LGLDDCIIVFVGTFRFAMPNDYNLALSTFADFFSAIDCEPPLPASWYP